VNALLPGATSAGQGWLQLGELALAFVLSALVGMEREFRHKSAGVRTYTLVGVAAALFMLVSKYGFTDVLVSSRVVLDPSRVAAQVVSGIGFIGGGVIFMRRDVVRGLTTAASVWLTAALGMACGAGLIALALATTAGHFLIMLVFPRVLRLIPRENAARSSGIFLTYGAEQGILRLVLIRCTDLRFMIQQVRVEDAGTRPEKPEAVQDRMDLEHDSEEAPYRRGLVTLFLRVRGKRPVSHLVAALSEIGGVVSVSTDETDMELD
jgi:putative Mg2+ transporter-C (MgtC) family protein